VTRLPARSPPATVRPISSPLTHSLARLASCAPAHYARSVPSPPPARAVPSPLCAITTVMASSPVLATSPPFPLPGHLKKDRPEPLVPPHQASTTQPPSLRPNRARRRRPSPLRVSSALLSLVAYGQIALALKLRLSVANLAHTFSSLIAPGSLDGDFTAASARHRAMDRPPQAPSGQIGPTPMMPDPRPGVAPTPPSPHSTPSAPLPLAHGPTPTAPSPRRSPTGGPGGPPARARLGRNLPPAQLAENPFSFSFSHFFFLFSYIYSFTDILCTKYSLNKL
jgi:hypothetical protein